MRTPADKTIVFTLYSHPMKDMKQRWKAHLTFPPGATDDTNAVLEIADGEGAPIASGGFEFAGTTVVVSAGRGLLRCGDFVRGKHEGGIWLHRKGVPPVPGALTFE